MAVCFAGCGAGVGGDRRRGFPAGAFWLGFRAAVTKPRSGGGRSAVLVEPWRLSSQRRERSDPVEHGGESRRHGQRAGIRSVHCRLLRVRRAGILEEVSASGAGGLDGRSGRPIWVAQRPRCRASAAITVHALFAGNRPEGKRASA